jgi:hypothetical protein
VGSKMNSHISLESLEAYVMGALDDGEASRVESHVVSCESCAARLQREAALEVAFAAVVTRTPAPSRIPRVATVSALAAAAVAMAATMVLWLAPRVESADRAPATVPDEVVVEVNADASTATASLDLQADGSRLGVRD